MLPSSKNMRQWLENVYKSGLPTSQAEQSESWYFYDERPALPTALGCEATSLFCQTETEEDSRLNPFCVELSRHSLVLKYRIDD